MKNKQLTRSKCKCLFLAPDFLTVFNCWINLNLPFMVKPCRIISKKYTPFLKLLSRNQKNACFLSPLLASTHNSSTLNFATAKSIQFWFLWYGTLWFNFIWDVYTYTLSKMIHQNMISVHQNILVFTCCIN